MAEDRADDLHERYYAYLLDRVRADRYPSAEMLTLIEEGMNEQEHAELVDVLLEKVMADRYPSVEMLRRLARVAG